MIARDVSQRQQLDHLQAHLAAIVESSDDAIISKDLTGTILSWNPGAERLYGFSAEQAVGQSIDIIVPDDLRTEMSTLIRQVAEGQRIDHHDTRRQRRDGSSIEVSLTISPIRDRSGAIVAASMIARDITDRKRIEQRLIQLAGEDQLTGLANRRTFAAALDRHVELCQSTGTSAAVVGFDIDRFKAVNDTLGHGAGDQLLKQTAARLQRRLRRNDVLARLGGDEFALIPPDASAEDAAIVAGAIVDEMGRNEIAIAGARCATASVGWTMLDEGVPGEEIMIRVDLASYEAKAAGGNLSVAYRAEHDARVNMSPASTFLADLVVEPNGDDPLGLQACAV